VVRAVLLRLDGEEVLRVANVPLQIRRHCGERPEQPGEDALIGADDWVGGIRYI
jgi:hypothetical protein